MTAPQIRTEPLSKSSIHGRQRQQCHQKQSLDLRQRDEGLGQGVCQPAVDGLKVGGVQAAGKPHLAVDVLEPPQVHSEHQLGQSLRSRRQ